ncbi:MAG TPA: hypothetical protein VGI10_01360 [Polyangiaceae bacterium]
MTCPPGHCPAEHEPKATRFPKHRGHPTKCECELCLNPTDRTPKPPPAAVDPVRARFAWLAGEA